MDGMNRRDAVGVLAAFALMAGRLGEAQETAAGSSEKAPVLSKLYKFDEMKVTPRPNGGWMRPVFAGRLPTGEYVELHETQLGPGEMPHAAHNHAFTELFLIRQGQVEFINDGKLEMAGPGDVIYAASMVMHGIKNVGTVPAAYFVMAVGDGAV